MLPSIGSTRPRKGDLGRRLWCWRMTLVSGIGWSRYDIKGVAWGKASYTYFISSSISKYIPYSMLPYRDLVLHRTDSSCKPRWTRSLPDLSKSVLASMLAQYRDRNISWTTTVDQSRGIGVSGTLSCLN